jgi:hypothetical protein
MPACDDHHDEHNVNDHHLHAHKYEQQHDHDTSLQ